eukprot:SAG31_NODE_3924_length_3748_cov_2.446150_1_plen_311_part_00
MTSGGPPPAKVPRVVAAPLPASKIPRAAAKILRGGDDEESDHASPLGSLSILPAEAMLSVMRMIPLEQVFMVLALVCREMFRLTRHKAVLPATLDFGSLGYRKGLHGKACFGKLLTALKALGGQDTKRLILDNIQWGKTSFKKVLKLCPNLETIDAGRSKKLHINDFQDLRLPAAPQLKAFHWHWAYGVPQRCVVANLIQGRAALESLSMSNWEGNGDSLSRYGELLFCPDDVGGADDTLLNALAEHCPNLQKLHLQGALNFSLAAAKELHRRCPKLTSVMLNNWSTTFRHGEVEEHACCVLVSRATSCC